MNSKTVSVIGLGYVGLPTAVLAAQKGWEVIGIDVDKQKIATIQDGKSPIEDQHLEEQLKQKPITATTDFSKVAESDVIIVAVPTPVTDTKEPDLTALQSALESLTPYLKEDQLLSIESTINPGVMETIVKPIIDTRPDVKVHIVHCPERINPGDKKWTVANIPRVIGGFTPEATEAGKEFYESILDADVKPIANHTEAEAVKILENTFRDINIAFVNEMAKSFDRLGIDITNVINGAATKPFSYLAHYPGNGVGGHCISVDPYYMIERARQVGFDHEFLQLARNINNSMPEYAVELLMNFLQEQNINPTSMTIAFLGLAYKKNIDDIRESPALTMLEILNQKNFKNIRVFDPHIPDQSTVDSLDAALQGAQVIIVATDHDEFTKALTANRIQAENAVVVIDGKNALDADAIAAAKIPYIGIGRRRAPD